MFEVGHNDEFTIQAILPGGVFGQKVVVPASKWRPSIAGEADIALTCDSGPNNSQQIGGVAFKVTNLPDEDGNPLTNESVIESIQYTSPGMDPSCVCAVVGSPSAFNPSPADNATIVDSRPVLTWSAGAGMASQKVYFSDSLADVEGMADSALVDETAQTLSVVWGAGSSYPDGLPSGTYYWRVTTIKDDQTEVAGKVWSFTILPGSAHDPIPVDGAIFVGKHHLRFAETGEYFLKCGADAPENFLAYRDFDGDFKFDGHKDNFIKDLAPHIIDWKQGDSTWQGGKGKGIIGAVNYLASKGMNVFSFLTLNIGGDDQNVFPYITYDERLRMDVSRLDQWEIAFEHADKLGMYLHFKTMETENELLLDKGDSIHALIIDAEDPTRDNARKNALWGNIISQAWGKGPAQRACRQFHLWMVQPAHGQWSRRSAQDRLG